MSKIQHVKISKLVEKVQKWNPKNDAPSETFTYIDISSINRDAKLISDVTVILGNEAPSRARQLVKKDDVLVSTVRPNLNAVAQISAELDGATASTGYCVLRPKKDSLDSGYLFHWVRTPIFVEMMVQQATGASYPAVNDTIVKASKIPLPPLGEQRRIAAVLDKADALRQKRRAALAKLDTLLQATFLHMFGDPVTNPMGWEKAILDDICTKITDGTHDTPKRIETGVKFITGKHIRPFFIDYDNSDYVSLNDHSEIYRRCNPELGDVLYTNIGVNLGTAALNSVSYEFSMKNVALLKPDRSCLLPRFLEHLLNNQNMKNEIVRIASQGGAQSFLSLSAIRKLTIPVPPLLSQNNFSKKVQKIFDNQNKLVNQQANLDNLFHALQQRAFNGQL